MVEALLGAMSVADWDPTTPEGRRRAYRDFLTNSPYAGHAPCDALLVRLDALEEGPHTALDEAAYARSFREAFFRTPKNLFASAWKAYDDARRAAMDELDPDSPMPGGEGPLILSTHGLLDRASRLAHNLVHGINDLNELPATTPQRVRLRLGMDALLHAGNLVRDVLFRAFSPKLAGLSTQERNVLRDRFPLIDNKIIRGFLNLTFVTGLPVPLGTLRNAWAHGDALLQDDRVDVYDEDTGALLASLSAKDIAIYLNLCVAIWHAFLVDGVAMKSILATRTDRGTPT